MEMHLSGNSESEDALHVRKSICNIMSLLFVNELFELNLYIVTRE